MHADFVHLRVHTAYSLSEGAIKADKIAPLAQAANTPAVAITDTGNLPSVLEFSQSAKVKGIQSIIGLLFARWPPYILRMDQTPDATRPTPQPLRAELDRSRDDLTTHRVVPLGSVLAAMHERASRRLLRHEQAEITDG